MLITLSRKTKNIIARYPNNNHRFLNDDINKEYASFEDFWEELKKKIPGIDTEYCFRHKVKKSKTNPDMYIFFLRKLKDT